MATPGKQARDAYDDDLPMREALQTYFQANGFAQDGGYAAKFVRVQIGPLAFFVPNTKARQRLLPFHDVHHVVTGYRTTPVGEAEIGAWELASGCSQFRTAWFLNGMAFSLGCVLDPGAVQRAWARGRRTRNAYLLNYQSDLIDKPVAQVKRELGTHEPDPPLTPEDRATFRKAALVFLGACGVPAVLAYAAPPALLLWWWLA